jgi:hypothetical protein
MENGKQLIRSLLVLRSTAMAGWLADDDDDDVVQPCVHAYIHNRRIQQTSHQLLVVARS